MADPITERPDVLVLGGGGTLGEAWMRGLLTGLEGAGGLDFRACEYFVGTSAGSIVAAALAGGRRPEAGARRGGADAGDDGLQAGARAAREWGERGEAPAAGDRGVLGRLLRDAGRAGVAAVSPFAPVALAGVAPAGAAVRAMALAAAPRPERRLDGLARHLDALGASFDGRLRVAAVDRASGRRVMFGAPGAPQASVRDAVLASCAVPWLFAPVRIGGREYVDGGVWSPTNLDAAPARRGTRMLCLVPTGSLELARSPLGAMRALSTAASRTEALAVRSRGAEVRTLVPDAASAAAMGPDLVDPGRAEAVLDAAFAQGRALAG